jgi:hypothetical protein
VADPTVESKVISRDQLPAEFDLDRTFRSEAAQVDAEAVLLSLWQEGFRILRAWECREYECFDPMGPRFTIELENADDRILDRGFKRGHGRLYCCPSLLQYTISR